MSKIIVIGSSNTDIIARVNRFPTAGETIKGISYLQVMGGKGANQALAAHRLGGNVKFITSLGNDLNGINSLEYYKKENLDASLSLITNDVSSGVAMIWVDDEGENSIVVIPGANALLRPEYILKVEKEILDADIIVMQMEIPYVTVKTVCDIAYRHQKKILLNVAPAYKLDIEIIQKISILIVNETEAETISGESIKKIGEEAVIDKLLELGAKTIVLTLGKRGSLMKNRKETLYVPAFKVKTVDTTAAGDTFCGALAAKLSKNYSWADSLKFATAASAICVMRTGAQPSIPTTKEVQDFLKMNNNNL